LSVSLQPASRVTPELQSGLPANATGMQRTLTAADGTALFVNDWLPEGAVGGGIVLMHGLGEHCGRYAHVARFFNDLGLAVRAYDHRGHGRSGGARGDVPDGDRILDDAAMVVADFSKQYPKPLLLGHSMGGLFAARFAVEGRAPLRGLILSSPALALPLSAGQKLLAKLLAKVAPGLAIPNGLERRYLSHDPKVVDAYNGDPLVHAKISARLLRCMLASIAKAHAKAPALRLPTLIVAAGDDHLVDARGSRSFFDLLSPGMATLHIYPQLYHEIFNELEAEQVFSDVRAWLQKL
jgi:alpha-beta hydrolase superfamily lysophospholipase